MRAATAALKVRFIPISSPVKPLDQTGRKRQGCEMRRQKPPILNATTGAGIFLHGAAAFTCAQGWFYFRDEDLVAREARVLLKDEARRMAGNFARLPEPLVPS
jgi:hypothetical protein